ncbi:expressed unknown protein [Seminavis robusta]|uniref:Uncharacterized protein n=1 Tax=Seminavis robusta TaxID=568900 RepID=A0A9N8DL68_9STRA|nr:expressed unknown protein [Seminavis robusta]|eukprot:Sro218_g090220.1 n/a (616) ;mRNA; r:82769-84616
MAVGTSSSSTSTSSNKKRKKGEPTDAMIRRPRRSITSFTMEEICDLRHLVGAQKEDPTVVALIYVHGSWNTKACLPKHGQVDRFSLLEGLFSRASSNTSTSTSSDEYWNVIGALQVDRSDDTYACCVGDDSFAGAHSLQDLPIPPDQLPVLAVAIHTPDREHARVKYLTQIPPSQLLWYSVLQRNPKLQQNKQAAENVQQKWANILQTNIQETIQGIQQEDNQTHNPVAVAVPTNSSQQQQEQPIRIFVAGDRSSVGKSSVCLGLLGSLLQAPFHYQPSQLAYIKPATQCEATQLVQTFCETKGIAQRAVGPLVYYKGFTRAFLAGETDSTQALLQQCAAAVDDIARNKKVVLVDGVGFPAVGSICGTDNASVCKACSYPISTNSGGSRHPMGVLIVGGSGVGAAVDSFNLNATYFQHANIPVMGGIFNKLSTDPKDYYSLEHCKTAVTAYFEQRQHAPQAFGFVPKFDAMDESVDEFINVFGSHVNIAGILKSAQQIQQQTQQTAATTTTTTSKTTVDTVHVDGCTVTVTTTTTRSQPNDNDSGNQSNKSNKRVRLGSGQGTPFDPNVRSSHFPTKLKTKLDQEEGTTNKKRKPPLSRDDIEFMASQAGAAGTA